MLNGPGNKARDAEVGLAETSTLAEELETFGAIPHLPLRASEGLIQLLGKGPPIAVICRNDRILQQAAARAAIKD